MRGPHNIWRLIRTGATFERTGAMGVVLDAFDAPKVVRIAFRTLVWPFKWTGIEGDPSMPPAPRALSALGPAYIKFGQILSTRPDVVGQDLANQLRVLQDKLPPFGIEQAEGIIASRTSGPQALAPDVIVDFSISIYSSCFYCSESNGANLAEIYPALQSVEQRLDDPQSAPIPQSYRAVFDWAETFARRSWTFTADHLKALRGVGMDDAAIVHMAVKGAIQTWMMMILRS